MARAHDFTEDYYAVLGLSRGASDDEIRRAGRTKQRESHPDLGGSSEAFIRVRVAVEVLTDPELRDDHDAWLAGNARQRRGRLRTQRRSGTATATRSGRGGPSAAAQQTGPAGARRPPGTFVPRTETPPPARIPKPDTDVRRMAWYRTAWADAAEQWPAEHAKLPGLRAGELAWVIVHTLTLIAGTLLLVVPGSIAEWRFPDFFGGGPGLPLWPAVAVFVANGLAWLLCRIFVRGRVYARISHIVTIALAALIAITAFILAFVALLVSNDFFADPVFQRSIVQAGIFALYAVSGFIVWRVLGPRTRTVLRDRLLVELAATSAPGVDDPTRVWGRAGHTAMGGEDTPAAVNPMRAMLAQRVVGEALEQLQRMPGVRIVHGIRAAGIGTVPHAIIAGRSIALIDAQLWAPATYGVSASGMITRDGHDMPSAAVEFPHIVERFHRLLGETARVKGWITVLPDREGEAHVDTSRTWQRVRLATTAETLREVGDWLAPEGERVDRLLLRDLLRHRA